MKIEQFVWTQESGWDKQWPGTLGTNAQFVLVFAGTTLMERGDLINDIRKAFPDALIAGCSTAGEIHDTRVYDDTITVTTVHLEQTSITGALQEISRIEESRHKGELLASALKKKDLKHVLVISDGLTINGSELVRGLISVLPPGVSVTGGLSGDGNRFEKTFVILDKKPARGLIAAIGFYGGIRVGYGSYGGWDPFGPERLITRSSGNVLYELDGKPALELYKLYLGNHARNLPATGLLFPLSLRLEENGRSLVRTLLSVNESTGGMIFAGDMPEGVYARLMKANFDRLIDGATEAAKTAQSIMGPVSPDLAILISCVGRRLVLRQRVEEEIEGVKEIFGQGTSLTGFYSYGEICPFANELPPELHNQTMTITTFSERVK